MSNLADFDLTIRAAEDGYTIVVDQAYRAGASPPQPFRLPLDVAMLPRQRRDVAAWVQQARITRLGVASAELQQVQSFGRMLFEGLFQDEVLASFRESRRALEPQQRLRIRLRTPPDLAPIPWELLYDPRDEQFLALMPDIVLLRCPPESAAPFVPQPIAGPLQIAVVLASPARYPPINLDRELRWIQESLRGPIERGQVALDVIRGAGTLDQLRDRLRRPAHILHILCHGDIDTERGEGYLVFEDPTGDAEKINAELLRLQIQKQRGQTCLVTLNACLGGLPAGNDPFSSVGAALIHGGVPAVIAMQFEIAEESAAELTRVLYAELAAGVPVDLALDEARLTIYGRSPTQLDWAVPVLFTHTSDGALFEGITAAAPGVVPAPKILPVGQTAAAEPLSTASGPTPITAQPVKAMPSWLIPAGIGVVMALLLAVLASVLTRQPSGVAVPPTALPAVTAAATSPPSTSVPSSVPTSMPSPESVPSVTPLPSPQPTIEAALDPSRPFSDFPVRGSPPIIARRLTIEEWQSYVSRYAFGDPLPSKVILIGTDSTPELANPASWQGLKTLRTLQASYAIQGQQAGVHILIAPDGIWLSTPMSSGGVHSLGGDGGTNPDGSSWYSIGIELIGDYSSARPEGVIWEQTKAVLGGLSQRLEIPPDQLIVLQRSEISSRTSPGAAITSDWVIAETNAWIAANPAPTAPEYKPIRRFAISVVGSQRSIEIWSLVREELRQTIVRTNGNAFNPALSADGTQVAFISDRGTGGKNWLYVHDLTTDEERLLTADLENAGDPAWSPHGALIAFVTTRAGVDQIYLVDANGGIARPLSNADARGRVPTWSPDGSQLAFVSSRSGRDLVYIANPSSGEAYPLLAPSDQEDPITSLTWSPDGRYLALVVGAMRLMIIDLQSAIQPYLLYGASYGIDTVTWSDDGGLLLLSLQDRQGKFAIWIAAILRGTDNQLSLAEPDLLMGGAEGESLSDPSWQPRAR